MTQFREKAQGHTKQVVGQLIGDDRLVVEGTDQVRAAQGEPTGHHSDHGIVKNEKGEEQPKDKERAQAGRTTGADHTISNQNAPEAK